MFDELRFRLKVQKIRRQEKREMAQIRLEFKHKHGSGDFTEEQLEELMFHDKMIINFTQEEIAKAYTWHLLEQMDKLLLHQPDFYSRGQWISSQAGGMHLNSEALAEIRDVIRKERKDRSEVTRLWITTIGGGIGVLTGLIGATIGLLAYLDKLHR